MKDELGGNIMTKFVGLRAKNQRYLTDDSSKDEKSEKHKKVCHKKKTLKIIKTVQKQLNFRTK